ncbi:MAG: RagB/SusD family nutrient uptake outer membrane protein [Chitinophagaceae bacterium]
MKPIVKYIFLLAAGSSMMVGCKKNFENPNDATQTQTLSSAVGLTGVAVGVQKAYSTSRAGSLYNLVCANGFSTFELSNRNTGNVDETNLFNGGISVDGNNAVLGNLWASNLKVIYDADNVINNAAKLGDKSYASGLIGYASIFKALALGSLAEFWEKVPDTVAVGNTANFIDRNVAYGKAVAVLDRALATIAANPISTSFISNIPAGIEIPNTLQALKARYSLFAGNYSVALTAANAVNLTVKSEMRFDAVSPNPIFNVSTATNNVFQVRDSTFGLPVALRPVMSDKRVNFYMSINTAAAPRWRINGFGAALSTAWPIYLPSEMTLIKAECYARASTPDLGNAVTELNKILTKTPAGDPFGIGADQPAYSGANTQADILTEIYRNRCIELYMQGWKMEDMRRFGRSNTPGVEKNRNFYPYPFRERDNNPNTPTDPTF